MRAILHLMRKEFLQVMKDRAMLGIIFFIPIVQLFILGYAITTDITNIALIIEDRDNTSESRALLDRFAHSPLFHLVDRRIRNEDKSDEFDRGSAVLTIVIDSDFESALRRQTVPAIQLLVDGVDSNSALVAAGYARSIIISHLRQKLQLPFTSAMQPRALYNPTLESKFTVVPGIVALLLTIVTMLLTALGLVREREIGTLEQLNVTPIRKIELIIGKVLPFAILGSIAFTIAMTVAVLQFHIPVSGSYGTLALFTGVYFMTSLGLGILVSTVTSTQQQAVFFAWFILVASILMSGFMFPISNMPVFLQKITYAIPLRYYIAALRDILLKGSGIGDLSTQLISLVAFGIGILGFSIIKFRKRI
jgi:ABC-2 type transport system permease protein